jgi:hypothetical protein
VTRTSPSPVRTIQRPGGFPTPPAH